MSALAILCNHVLKGLARASSRKQMAHRLGSKEQGSLFADDIIFYEENNEACTSLMILARL